MVGPSPVIPAASGAEPLPRYGLEDLLAVAGERLGEDISSRTVRLYATQGLIDRPSRDGRSAIYSQRHLLQLLLIRSLARRGLSLAAIAPLCGLPDEELRQQLRQLEQGLSTPDVSSSEPTATNPALSYLQSIQPTVTERSSALLPLLGSPLPGRSPKRSKPSGSRDAASRWSRFSLAPGIEVHISDSVPIPPEGAERTFWLNHLTERLSEQLDGNSP